MASNSGFTDQLPSATSKVADGDNEFRQLKTFMKNWWEDEHYGMDGSTNSAGVHKTGSARAYVQAAAPTAVQPKGGIWMDTDNQTLFVHDDTSWLTAGLGGTKIKSFKTAIQSFSKASCNGHQSAFLDSFDTVTAGIVPSVHDVGFVKLAQFSDRVAAFKPIVLSLHTVDSKKITVKLSNVSSTALSTSEMTLVLGMFSF